MRLLFTLLALVLLLTPVASRQLTAIRVSEGDDLQAVLDTATGGDTILLEAGARFVGNFILPNHGPAPTFVTIRTDASDLPGPGTRTSPQYGGRLAVLQSPDQSAALSTAPGAHHWRIENVEFRASESGGSGDIIALGAGGERQRQIVDVPQALVFDRVYVHGDARVGQKRGISLNSGATEIVNSHFSDLKAAGQDAQAIAGWNGPGPYRIENNYIEAAGENILFGGADPGIDGLVPGDITIRRNHFTRPLSWREPLLRAPADVRATASYVDGTLSAGEYVYRVVAERPVSGSRARSEASAPVSVQLQPGGTGTVTLEWKPVAEAASYRVYRRDPANADMYWRTETPRFTDGGAPGTNGTPRPATVWTVKNLLELKNARNVVIDGNLFEHHWAQAQSGYAIVFTPRNQDGQAPWSRVEHVRFTNNIVRKVGAFLNLTGADDVHPSGRTRDIVIRNNLLEIDNARWGGNGDFVQLGHGPVGIVIEQNTVIHAGRMLSVYGSDLGRTIDGLVFRGNVLRHNRYGVIGADAAPGQGTFTKYLPGAVFVGNVIAGGRASSYPRDNHFVTVDEFAALFVHPAAGDYRVKEGAYAGAGANLAAVEAATGVRTTSPAAQETPLQSSR